MKNAREKPFSFSVSFLPSEIYKLDVKNTTASNFFLNLYYYVRSFYNLSGVEQWYFSLIWNTWMWKFEPFVGSSINK